MRKVLILGFALLFLLLSCTDTATPGQVKLVIQNGEPIITKGNRKFTGELWTSDHRICDEVKDGKIVKCTIYHKNGNVASVSQKSDKAELEFFDENGTPMGEDSFIEKYMPDFMESIEEFNSMQIEH